MSFGPIMQFSVNDLQIQLAPPTREAMQEFINLEYGGGMQRLSVTRYLGRSQAPVAADEDEWFNKARNNQDDIVWSIWAVENGKRTIIGNSGLHHVGRDGQSGFIRQATSGSVIFQPEYWGKGIASSAHKARAWYAFTQLGLHRIKSGVIQGNVGSSRALSRSGYTYTYTERNEQYVDGQLLHKDCYECLNPLDLFWSQWWHGERPTAKALQARKLTLEALAWADQNVVAP